MSIGAMSDTVVDHILKGLRDKIAAEIDAGLIDKNLKEFKSGSILGEEVRTGSNKIQEGIITQRSLDTLANEFNEATSNPEAFLQKRKITDYSGGKGKKAYPLVVQYLESGKSIKDLAKEAATFLGSSNTFDLFVEWYKTKYLGSEKKSNITFSDQTVGTRYEQGLVVESGSSNNNDLKALIASNLTHAEFNKRFIDFVSKTSSPAVAEFIDANTDAGHFLGVFNIKFASLLDLNVVQSGQSVSSINVSSGLSSAIKEEAEQIAGYNNLMQNALQLMANSDLITSNLLSNIKLASTTSKIVYRKKGQRSSIELQLSLANQEAGRKLVAAGRQLKNLARAAYPSGGQGVVNKRDFKAQLVKLFEAVASIGTYIDKIGTDIAGSKFKNAAEKALAQSIQADSASIVNVLMNTEGSDSFNTAIDNSIHSAFSNKSGPTEQVSTVKNSVQLAKKSNKILNLPKLKKSPAPKISKPVTVQIPKISIAQPTNLISLQSLLNAQLAQQIKDNMGSGNRKDILNLRTGRFAESVKVERLSESRQGMITAFYTYMRNPYATFSEGGKQQSPRSRDPKLLISKSIREIAQDKIQNRLRAVLV
jgi:hypothetical protein